MTGMVEFQLDDILIKIGSWNRYQFYVYTCLSFVGLFSAFQMSYIFTARSINYRCSIPFCDENNTDFRPEWLENYVPFENNSPSQCLVYEFSPNTSSCPNKTEIFRETTRKCNQFVYEREEPSIIKDFELNCQENLWKLTMGGTISVLGEMFCLSYTGFFSDKWGRKTLMMTSVLSSATVGLLRSFAPDYYTYVTFEFLDTFLGGGMFGATFVLAMELVDSKCRNKANLVFCLVFTAGEIVLGLTAYFSSTWRQLLRILYSTGFVTILFIWTVPESIRWLISKQRVEEATKILHQIAKVNKCALLQEELDTFLMCAAQNTDEGCAGRAAQENIVDALRCRPLLLRFLNCSFCWICCNFIYYGLTIHSVSISDNVYWSFIFIVAIEVPGYLIYYYVNEKTGRKRLMCASLLIGGVCCLIVGFLPHENEWVRLFPFLLGKCFITIAYTVLYVYTTELFPTSVRHTMFSICSMFGRFGSMIAPQVPLLASINKMLPLIMFGGLAGTSGVLVLLLPETFNIKLPDTISEAIQAHS